MPVVFVVTFRDGLIAADVGYFDLITLCDQGGLLLEEVSAATKQLSEAFQMGVTA